MIVTTQSNYSNLIYLLICMILYILQAETSRTEEGLELLFRARTESDWANVWHHETHSRCREKLLRQLHWACEKDIYRLTRRNKKRTDESIQKIPHKSQYTVRWLSSSPEHSSSTFNTLLRTRRTADVQSITSECCTKIGCTWEEYAEYCNSNKRRNHY